MHGSTAALDRIDTFGTDSPLRPLALAARPLRQPDLADTIESIASEGRCLLYEGELGAKISKYAQERGGALSRADLLAHHSQWAAPLKVRYRDATVYSQPPVSMGALLLVALRLFEQRHNTSATEVDTIREMVAIKKLVFGRVLPLLGDPRIIANPDVIDEKFIATLHTAGEPTTTLAPTGSDTTTLAVAGPDGMSISFIHSLFNEFGARELVPGTGIVLNDRLANLDTSSGLPNQLAGGEASNAHAAQLPRRTNRRHSDCGRNAGWARQVQTNLQVLTQIIDRRLDLQSAIDLPRWVHGMPRVSPTDDTLYLEAALAHHRNALIAEGHRVELLPGDNDDHFGSCTAVASTGNRKTAAADHRRSAAALTY